jgi:hypothetical protein
MELPKLPTGWRWERYANEVNYYATNNLVDVGVWCGELDIAIKCTEDHSDGEWTAGSAPISVLALVLKANGVTL